MTSSPGPIPKIRRVNSIAAVAEFKQAALFVPIYSAILFSNFFVLGPVVIHPDFNALMTSSTSSSVTSGGEKGIFLTLVKVILLYLTSFFVQYPSFISMYNNYNNVIFIN